MERRSKDLGGCVESREAPCRNLRKQIPERQRLKTMTEKSCPHLNFEASVNVIRIKDKGRFVAEIHIRCKDCETPFQFMGLNPGFDFDGATVSLDGLEANIGIYPNGVRPNPLQDLMGYTVKSTN